MVLLRWLKGRWESAGCTYEHVQPHVPDFQVAEAVKLALEYEVDAIIGLGGGSPIGMAKAVSFALEERRAGSRQGRLLRPSSHLWRLLLSLQLTPVSEMTPIYGITHHSNGTTRKITVTDVKITPKLVVYDPLLTLNLPPGMTASTGRQRAGSLHRGVVFDYAQPPRLPPLLLECAPSPARSRAVMHEEMIVEARSEMLQGAYWPGLLSLM